MSSLPYALSPLNTYISDQSEETILVFRDGEWTREKELDVQVRSGNYFATLATTLDLLSQMRDTEYGSDAILQKTVDDLLYLEKNYTIVRKQH